MNYIEQGKENKEVIILLHGGGLSTYNYNDEIKLLASKYHVILPILDGHSGSDSSFTSIKDNAEKIIKFIDDNFNSKVSLIGGLSLGGQILLEMLAIRNNICDYALVESALVVPSKLTNILIKPSINLTYNLIKKRWFAKLQFKYLKIKEEYFELYYENTCNISKIDMINFLKENSTYTLKENIKNTKSKVFIFVCKKENRAMVKSSELINKTIRGSKIYKIPKLKHGEFSINYGEYYVNIINSLLNKE